MIMQDDMGLNDDKAVDEVPTDEVGAVEPGAEIVEEPGLDADEDDKDDEEVI